MQKCVLSTVSLVASAALEFTLLQATLCRWSYHAYNRMMTCTSLSNIEPKQTHKSPAAFWVHFYKGFYGSLVRLWADQLKCIPICSRYISGTMNSSSQELVQHVANMASN